MGFALAIGCVGYLVDLFARFLAPGIGESISPFVLAPAAIGELLFVGLLLVKGVSIHQRDTRVPAMA